MAAATATATASGDAHAGGECLPLLTDRERDVLRLVGRGHTNAEIAAELFISQATVKSHLGRILAKLDLRDRAAAIVLAYRDGLV